MALEREAFNIWEIRNQNKWTLDLSILSNSGIKILKNKESLLKANNTRSDLLSFFNKKAVFKLLLTKIQGLFKLGVASFRAKHGKIVTTETKKKEYSNGKVSEWKYDELSELAFEILVLNFIKENHNYSVNHQYEVWQGKNINTSIIVKIKSGSSILIGEKDDPEGHMYRYKEVNKLKNDVELRFVKFGNPLYDENDLLSLDYVIGSDSGNAVMCAKKEDCKFYLIKNK